MQSKQSNLDNQVTHICNMCMAMGIHKTIYEGQNKLLSHMPVSLYPYEISEQTYNRLVAASAIWVKLLLKVSKDKQFVNKVFQKTAHSDNFVKRFLDLYNKYIDRQKYGMANLRVDYMGDQQPELVQFNLVSVGPNGMSDYVQRLAILKHKHRSSREVYYPQSFNQVEFFNAVEAILNSQKLKGIVLMVVHEKFQKQFNFGDHNAFQLQALKRQLKVKRVSMSQLISQYKVNEQNQLYIGEQKVAVVYFRTAYSPTHFLTEDHWKLREQIQGANVLKIPSISMQLINFKRMQVELSNLQVLKNYLPEDQALLLKSLTGQIYHFENSNEIEKLISLTQTNDYVLKSNRQGGGNNYFGQVASQKVNQFHKIPEELWKYVLMNKIKSEIRDNVFIANYRYQSVKQCTCQFSTFASFAYKQDKLIYNKCEGTLLRLKRAEQNEGGIAIDKAVLSGFCVVKDS